MSPLVHSVVDILLQRLEDVDNHDKAFDIYPWVWWLPCEYSVLVMSVHLLTGWRGRGSTPVRWILWNWLYLSPGKRTRLPVVTIAPFIPFGHTYCQGWFFTMCPSVQRVGWGVTGRYMFFLNGCYPTPHPPNVPLPSKVHTHPPSR